MIRKTSANIFLNSAGVDSGRRRGLGRNPGNSKQKFKNHCLGQSIPFFYSVVMQSFEVHPRHPPRAFPLGLLAPRCQCAGKQNIRTAQIPGNEPFTRLPATSWGEEVSSPRVGHSSITRSLPSPSPLYVFQYCV